MSAHDDKSRGAYVPVASTSSSTGTLTGIGLTDGCDLQSVHTNPGVVYLELAEPAINDIHDAVDCKEATESVKTGGRKAST